jgi:hypothetical protein
MTTKKKDSALPPLAGADQQTHDELLTRLERLRAIQREYAAAIIAAGIFSNLEHWPGVVAPIAEEEAGDASQALEAFFGRLEREAPDSTTIPFPLDDDPTHTEPASDVVDILATRWGAAGFLVGLAVGQQLGPHAFDGGER